MILKTLITVMALIILNASLVLAKPHAFPVPFVATNPEHVSLNGIRFTDLPGPGSVKIFNILGEKVRELTVPATDNIITWDLRNSSGRNVSTGVYIYIIKSGSSETKGKAVIIR